MSALIPALIKLFLSGRGGGGGGGGGMAGGGGRKSPEEYSMELLDKNARREGIQKMESRMRGSADVNQMLEQLIRQQQALIEEANSDDKE